MRTAVTPLSPTQASTLAAPWNLSGVLATLQSRASALLTEDGPLFEAAPHASAATAALGTGLDAMGRVAAVVGIAIDSFVEVRKRPDCVCARLNSV